MVILPPLSLRLKCLTDMATVIIHVLLDLFINIYAQACLYTLCHIVCSPNRIMLNINSCHADKARLKHVPRIFLYLFYPWIRLLPNRRGYCLRAVPDTVSSVCPPPLSPVSDFVSLAICSHCAALPDGRHSGRLGSVNCKGMWHSVLKLRMFLWISGVRRWHFFFSLQSGESVSAQVNTEYLRGILFSGDGDTVCAISNDTCYHKSVLKHVVLRCCSESQRSIVWLFYDYPQLQFASVKLSRGKHDELFVFHFRNVSIAECAIFFNAFKTAVAAENRWLALI